ncbi:hypothetical protein QP141_04530 [Alloscardovia omnicolens]|uniref:hypothetical protein n=1 Tax=Alloscardovia omnicolens TaxID=419015 RepID=UPI00079AD174|nr:hypothetical protein [Alloscardovia omnicolens]KWZ74051.1 hypothetical protein HMPREF3214_00897 [Alloscardovia omnicolens]MBS6346535.1 hypothetical protein [Alloscardovia omnicolens]MDK6249701.1 hypothetical protein [Alloscardovia omnicolens]MDK6328213.1 hypothetical protein [Alloscardovia omnicolens]MDK6643186.1 hypothetical protein [Alloscardovia omnicolens]
MKKKIPAHWLCAILTLCWLVFTAIVCFLDSVPHQNVLINLYVAHITAQDVCYILGFILLLWILYGFIRLWKISGRVARFLLVLLGWIPIMLISFLASFVLLMSHAGASYTELSSPDGQHTLVAQEHSFLLLGSASLYERTSVLTVKEIPDAVFLPDDGFAPFSANEYWVQWNQHKVAVAVNMNDNRKWDALTMDLSASDYDVHYYESRSSKHTSLNDFIERVIK